MNLSGMTVSTNPSKMDIEMIQHFLSTTYWAEGRTRKQVQDSINHSTPFGLFLGEQQIAFARVLSDQTIFAYLMDVFVTREHQGKGYASAFLEIILKHPEFQSVQTWMLKTRDAHPLYEGVGFTQVKDSEQFMVL